MKMMINCLVNVNKLKSFSPKKGYNCLLIINFKYSGLLELEFNLDDEYEKKTYNNFLAMCNRDKLTYISYHGKDVDLFHKHNKT